METCETSFLKTNMTQPEKDSWRCDTAGHGLILLRRGIEQFKALHASLDDPPNRRRFGIRGSINEYQAFFMETTGIQTLTPTPISNESSNQHPFADCSPVFSCDSQTQHALHHDSLYLQDFPRLPSFRRGKSQRGKRLGKLGVIIVPRSSCCSLYSTVVHETAIRSVQGISAVRRSKHLSWSYPGRIILDLRGHCRFTLLVALPITSNLPFMYFPVWALLGKAQALLVAPSYHIYIWHCRLFNLKMIPNLNFNCHLVSRSPPIVR